MSEGTYSISDLAREFDITTRTIRFYEDKGLLSPARQGQTRIYSPADRTRLKLILRGKRLGFTLEESREIIDLYSPSSDNRDQLHSLIAKVQERRAALEQQRTDIELMLVDLQTSEELCLESLNKLDQAAH